MAALEAGQARGSRATRPKLLRHHFPLHKVKPWSNQLLLQDSLG